MSRLPRRPFAAATAVCCGLTLLATAACGGPTAAEVAGVYRLHWSDLPIGLPRLADASHRQIELEIDLRADGIFHERLGSVGQTRERHGKWTLARHRVRLEPETGEAQIAEWKAGELRLLPSGNHAPMTLHRTLQ